MIDRVPTPGKEGRVKITPENGDNPFYAKMEMADDAIAQGTPLNKATLLKDTTAQGYGLTPAPAVPDDVFALYTGQPKIEWQLVTEIITANTEWQVPLGGVRNNKVDVRLFGGGGGKSSYGAGGGGGEMEHAEITIPETGGIQITIGAAGAIDGAGGATSFGTYLSADGGAAGSTYNGGSGGTGGGGYGDTSSTSNNKKGGAGQYGGGGGGSAGGDGGTYGGGGGGAVWTYNSSTYKANPEAKGGNGGTYGGGGGSSYMLNHSSGFDGGPGGTGGTYGGDGGYATYQASFVNAENGTDTTGLQIEYTGDGARGTTSAHGSVTSGIVGGGGGGGYGGQGGNGASVSASLSGYNCRFGGAGGGGGYGGNGGDGYASTTFVRDNPATGGGGGGYGANGGAGNANGSGGGGGYAGGHGGAATSDSAGGGGGYGANNYGAGGGGSNGAAKSGVVILTYWKRGFVDIP